MRDAKTVLLKRLAKQSQAGLACCGELARIAREIIKICAHLSAIPAENFKVEELECAKEHGRRMAVISAAIESANKELME